LEAKVMRRGFAAIMSLAMAAAIMSSSEISWADPPGTNALPINVVTIKTDDADEQAEALTTALKAEVRKLAGWSLMEGDNSLEMLSLALRCPSPPDAACELRIADQIKADRFVWGTLKKSGGHKVEGALHMWTRSQGQTTANVSFSDNLTEANDDAMRKVAQDALTTLTGGPPKGSVRVTAGETNGQIFVDGQPSGAIHEGVATVFVSVGKHRIEVRAPGYAPASGEVSVSPNSSVALSLTPTTEEQASASTNKTSTKKLIGYGGIAGGLIFGIAGVYSSLKVHSISTDSGMTAYREGTDPGVDICDRARAGVVAKGPNAAGPNEVADMCSSGSTYQTLQYVFYGLGAISAGIGTYFILTDKPEQPSTSSARNIQFVPSAGRQGGGFNLRMSF
jgi:hypothetical protein